MRLDPTGLGSKGLLRYRALGIPDPIGSPQGERKTPTRKTPYRNTWDCPECLAKNKTTEHAEYTEKRWLSFGVFRVFRG